VLHKDSTALQVIQKTAAGFAVPLDPEGMTQLEADFLMAFEKFLVFKDAFSPAQVNGEEFDKFSAAAVTEKLALLCTKAVARAF
jgi:hypothetical protein